LGLLGAVPGGLIERESELARIDELLAATRTGDGGLLLFDGLAGIGKTALLRAAGERARLAGTRVLTARCSELEAGFSFGVARQLFEPLLASAGQSERESLLAGAARRAVIALDGQEDVAPPVGTDPAFRAIHGLYWMAVNASQGTPTLLVIDDLQWADPASLDFVLYLTARLDELPVGLVASWTTGEEDRAADRLRRLTQLAGPKIVHPAALTLAGTTNVLAAAFRQPPGQRFAVTCQEVSGGNPFLLRELAAGLRADGISPDDFAADQAAAMTSATIARSVTLRVTRLGEVPGRLSRAAAILGDGATLRHAATLAGLPLAEAAVAADRLAAIGVFEAGTSLRFAHPIVRAAVYGDIPYAERDLQHAQAARLLRAAGADLDAICAHLLACEPGGTAETAGLLWAAARRAMARAAPQNAVAYLRRAVAEPADTAQRAALLHELGRAEGVTREPTAIAHLREALDLAATRRERSEIAVDLAQLLVLAGQWDAGLAVIQMEFGRYPGGRGIPDAGAEGHAAAIRLWTCWACFAGYDPRLTAAFEDHLPDLVALARGPGPAQRVLAGFLAGMLAPYPDRAEQSRQLFDHAFAQGHLLGHVDVDPLFVGFALFAAVKFDDLARATALAEELLAQSRSRGSVAGVAIGICLRIAIRTRRADLRGAEADIRTLIEITVDHGMTFVIPQGLYWGAEALIERSELADVAALLSGIELEPGVDRTISGALMHEVRGRIAVAVGDLATARAELSAAARTHSELHRPSETGSPWRSALALAVARDDRAEALRLAAVQLDDAKRLGHPHALGIALRTHGVLEGGEPGLNQLREAADVLSRADDRLEHARTLVELGAALRRANHRAAARQPLREGLDLADRCGATRLTERARAELLTAGARPRRTALTGIAALTASERRVAELAANGLSNPEVAQALFVTLNTVEGHLRHVYQKLSVTSRQQLPVALRSVVPQQPD
jgi:DNA-binding CsgD family transcriptional regulator